MQSQLATVNQCHTDLKFILDNTGSEFEKLCFWQLGKILTGQIL